MNLKIENKPAGITPFVEDSEQFKAAMAAVFKVYTLFIMSYCPEQILSALPSMNF